ncbi:MAG: glycosyl transferase [Deltaproteobacteria bacterium]|nr:glycosyl transferase [Deltaproteobacteria bacterium]
MGRDVGVVISCFAKVGGTGISNVLFHTACAAHRAGVLDAVICYGNRQSEIPAGLIRPIRFQPVRVVSFLKARHYYTLKRMALDRRAARHIRRHECDVFHGWTTECLHSLREAKRIGAKTIVERPAPHPVATRRLLQEEYARWKVPFPRDDGHPWMKKIDHAYRDEVVAPGEFELADRVIVQSEYGLRSFLEEGFPSDRLVVLPRAVDLGEYAPLEREERDRFRVLFVGMVCLRKGFLDLARAWRELALPGGELLVVGQVHEEVVPLLEPYRADPTIRFLGHVSGGAARFYGQADVFALPSIVEGSAKTTYEAMAASLPVVTTLNAGSVVRDGIDGFIVPIRDRDDLKRRLLFLYENRDAARAMGEAARKRVGDFSWETYESRLIDLYGELMGAGQVRTGGGADA